MVDAAGWPRRGAGFLAMGVCDHHVMSDQSTIRRATADDLDFLAAHDRHVRTEVLRARVEAAQVLVVEQSSGLLGWLRWGLFWDEIPFMNMLFVLEDNRDCGLGGDLVDVWEDIVRADGHSVAMTSTRSDESARHFYRRRGYVDSGVLLLPGEPAEVILRKELA